MTITAASYGELSTKLCGLDKTVGLRGIDRKKSDTQGWIAYRVIKTLAKRRRLRFPLSFRMDDRPDLRVKSGTTDVGIELTEIISPFLAQADAIANSKFPQAIVDESLFSRKSKLSRQDAINYLQSGGGLQGSGYIGDAVEREWADAANETIQTKIATLNKPGFVLHSKNWLAAYSSAPGPMLDMLRGSKYLVFPKRGGTQQIFDSVLLLTDTKMLICDRRGIQITNVETIR